MSGAEAGEVLDRPLMTLERGKVDELARALRADPTSLPPTYTVLAMHRTPPGRSPHELVIAAAGLDPARVLLGSMEWVHHREPEIGSLLEGAVRLAGTTNKESRQSGSLRIATAVVEWRDANGPVAEVRSALLQPERPPAALHQDTSTAALPPDVERLVLTRTDIVRYAGASGDFNPIHHDHETAQALGYPDVFAMGLLPGGILAARLVASAGLPCLSGHRLSLAFRGIVWPGTPYAVDIGAPSPEAPGTASLHNGAGQALVTATLQPTDDAIEVTR